MRKLKYVKLFENFKKDDLPSVSEVNNILKNPIFIGSGGNANVYDLNDKYVLKIKKTKKELEINEIIPVEDTLPNINYGQIVAKTDKDYITILKKQKGVPVYVQGKTTLEDYTNKIKKLSKLPQETFDVFVKESKLLSEKDLNIDPSKSNNFLIDFDNNRINIVDVIESKSLLKIEYTWFFIPLVATIFIHRENLRGDEDLIPYWKIIKDKLLISCKKYNITQNNEYSDWIFSKSDPDDADDINTNTTNLDEGW
jgi:hypothetical protein